MATGEETMKEVDVYLFGQILGTHAHSKQINYKDSKIGLKLPIPISEISDYDLSAPFVSESGEEIGEEDPHFYKALDMRKFR